MILEPLIFLGIMCYVMFELHLALKEAVEKLQESVKTQHDKLHKDLEVILVNERMEQNNNLLQKLKRMQERNQTSINQLYAGQANIRKELESKLNMIISPKK